jgi:hypothetical protein
MMDEFFVSRAASPLSGLVKPMPDLSDDNAVESFLAAAGISGVRERVSGLPQDQKMVRVREADGCRIVGFTTPTSSIGRKVTVDFGRKGYVYEVDRGFIGETDKVVVDALDIPFKLYAVFEEKPQFFRKGAVYRREVVAPGGAIVAHRELVFTYDGKLPPYVPALNDAAGEWMLRYRDIATGRERVEKVDRCTDY